MPRPARASAFGVLSLLPLLILVPPKALSAPADTVSTVTASATFDADALGAPPDGTLPGPPAGDSLAISESSGTVRVRAAVGTLTSKPVEMNQVPGIGGLDMHVFPVALAGCDRATVRWRSLARSDTVCFLACVLLGPDGIMASVEYRAGGVLTYNSTGGPLTPLPVSYRPDVDQQFTVELDFAAQTSSVSVDGVALEGFQSVPFVNPVPALTTIGFEGGCTYAQDFAVDEISAVALCPQPDQPPTLLAPAVVNGEEGGIINFSVSASDPDGDPLGAFFADLSGLPEGASFTVNESITAGTFLWHPQVGDSGAYAVTFTAMNALTTVATTQINIGPTGTSVTGKLVWVPQPGQEGTYDVIFTASNPAGETGSATTHITVVSGAAAAAPAHPPLAAQLPQKGPIVRAPAGVTATVGDTVVVVVTATDADELPPPPPPPGVAGLPRRASAIAATALTLTADLSRLPEGNNATFTVDRQPEVVAPGTVYATDGTTLNIHVTASDPDGDPILAISADTSLLPPGQATFATDMHTTGDLTWNIPAGQVGTYTVTFSSSNALSGKATTTIFVSTVLQARAFQPGQDKKIKLRTLRPLACMQIEPVSAFALTDIDFRSVVMNSPGTGSVSQIPISMKSVVISDKDRNGRPDATVCFRKEDLRRIFSLVVGRVLVPVTIEGNLIDHRPFRAEITLDVDATGASLAAQVTPNPFNPEAVLTVTTTQKGRLRVSLYDLNGRLVRTLHDREAEAGEHAIRIDGRGSSGEPLASGVYFYGVEAVEGRLEGRVIILK